MHLSINSLHVGRTSLPPVLIIKNTFFAAPTDCTYCTWGLLTVASNFGWQLEAWAIFSNHYHFVAHSPLDEPDAQSLSEMLGLLHEKTAKWINRLDAKPGRQVWHNFWETRLTYQKSYLARLNYVHQNPVKHGLVAVANQYPWCSARWFERVARPAQIKTIYSLKTNRLNVYDEYEGNAEW